MKIKNGLLEKRIDLKNSQINGGKLMGTTYSYCTSQTGTPDCPDHQNTQYDDKGNVLFSGTHQLYENCW